MQDCETFHLCHDEGSSQLHVRVILKHPQFLHSNAAVMHHHFFPTCTLQTLYRKHKKGPLKAAGLLTKIVQFRAHQYSGMRKSVWRHLSFMEAVDIFSWHSLDVTGKSVLQPQTNYSSITLRSQFSVHLAQILYCYPHR